MKVFMVIVFILANGQEVMLNGWSPSAYESLKVCQQKKAAAAEYIEYLFDYALLPEYYAGYKITCTTEEEYKGER
tara:strand:- start:509 stop:733 length:225 start_codon:yes stop_codon:yes gene_type:complete